MKSPHHGKGQQRTSDKESKRLPALNNLVPRNSAVNKVPEIVADASKPTAWVEPDGKQPLQFRALGQSQPITMVPLYQIIRERYAVYWKVSSKAV